MEHVEEKFVEVVLAEIASLCDSKAFFVISTRKALHTLPDGSNAHRTIKPKGWWLEHIKTHFQVTQELPSDAPDEFRILCEVKTNGSHS